MPFWFWMSTVALVFFGITGVTQKLSTNRISFELSFVWFSAAFLLLALIIGFTMSLDWHLTPGLIALAGAVLGAVYPGFIAVRQDPIEALTYE